MTLSTELTRFLADHATAESWAAFANVVELPPTAANLAATMSAKGYQVSEADLIAALEFSKRLDLTDEQLTGVVGGQGGAAFHGELLKMLAAAGGAYAASEA